MLNLLKKQNCMRPLTFFLLLISLIITLPFAVQAQNKDSAQGDFEALQAFYHSTQGDNLEVLASENDLPAPSIAPYPFMYMIDGEIWTVEFADNNGFKKAWVNVGKP